MPEDSDLNLTRGMCFYMVPYWTRYIIVEGVKIKIPKHKKSCKIGKCSKNTTGILSLFVCFNTIHLKRANLWIGCNFGISAKITKICWLFSLTAYSHVLYNIYLFQSDKNSFICNSFLLDLWIIDLYLMTNSLKIKVKLK